MEENKIWEGNPSQWSNFGTLFICALTFWLVIPIFIAIWKILDVKFWKFEITDQRIIVEKGILSKTTNELELYRVKDLKLEQPFLLRLVGLSNLLLVTSDKTHSLKKIPAIPNGKDIREELRISVEKRRDEKRVREIDF